MKQVRVNKLSLGAFLKLSSAVGIAFGLMVGVMGLIGSVVGADVFISLYGLPRLTGLLAGVVGLPLMPVAFALLGILAGLILYWPTMRIVAFLGGLRVQGS